MHPVGRNFFPVEVSYKTNNSMFACDHRKFPKQTFYGWTPTGSIGWGVTAVCTPPVPSWRVGDRGDAALACFHRSMPPCRRGSVGVSAGSATQTLPSLVKLPDSGPDDPVLFCSAEGRDSWEGVCRATAGRCPPGWPVSPRTPRK